MSSVKQRFGRIAKASESVAHSYGIRPIDRRIGAVTVGNPNGIIPEVAGEAAIRKSRLFSGGTVPSHPTTESETLRRQGFLDLDKVFEDELIDRIQSKFEELIQDDDMLIGWDPDEYDETFLKAIGNDLIEHIPEIAQFITPYIGKIVSARYGSHFQVRQCYAYRNYHIPPEIEEEIYANYWHIDAQTPDHLKLFVNLTDVTERDGPLHLIPNDDTRRLSRKVINWDRQREGIPNRLVEPESDVYRFTGEKGTAMLANTYRTLHRAGVPEEGRSRDLFQFVLAPASEPLSYDWYTQGLDGVASEHFRRPLRY